jgi:hypothetical protein
MTKIFRILTRTHPTEGHFKVLESNDVTYPITFSLSVIVGKLYADGYIYIKVSDEDFLDAFKAVIEREGYNFCRYKTKLNEFSVCKTYLIELFNKIPEVIYYKPLKSD